MNEKQVRQLVDDLEVRYLANRDPNIFTSLFSPILPDSVRSRPVSDATRWWIWRFDLIDELNTQYASATRSVASIFSIAIASTTRAKGVWMGWERKRGKLLDLNQATRGNVYDAFPVKAGDLKRLPSIRYVLTLDSDTQLPRGAAQRMIGAMAHPLNQAVIDPGTEHRDLQDMAFCSRVWVSACIPPSRSRLAAIYSGQTGFDIYTRAISDVYQDLYGEASSPARESTKSMRCSQVLEHRFPRNALLSHDLIEGAYARAGLAYRYRGD